MSCEPLQLTSSPRCTREQKKRNLKVLKRNYIECAQVYHNTISDAMKRKLPFLAASLVETKMLKMLINISD